MEKGKTIEAIESARTYLGIELGSTRIKGVLIGPDHTAIASGGFVWENRFENGVWTYGSSPAKRWWGPARPPASSLWTAPPENMTGPCWKYSRPPVRPAAGSAAPSTCSPPSSPPAATPGP